MAISIEHTQPKRTICKVWRRPNRKFTYLIFWMKKILFGKQNKRRRHERANEKKMFLLSGHNNGRNHYAAILSTNIWNGFFFLLICSFRSSSSQSEKKAKAKAFKWCCSLGNLWRWCVFYYFFLLHVSAHSAKITDWKERNKNERKMKVNREAKWKTCECILSSEPHCLLYLYMHMLWFVGNLYIWLLSERWASTRTAEVRWRIIYTNVLFDIRFSC